MTSINVPNGQIAHQKRPSVNIAMGIRGHHSTQVRLVPTLALAAVGPHSRAYTMYPNTTSTGYAKMPGYSGLFRNARTQGMSSRLRAGPGWEAEAVMQVSPCCPFAGGSGGERSRSP